MTDVYIRDLLECPVCMDTIDSVPIFECVNGHAICKVCIEKLNNCPLCRNDSAPIRSFKHENIVQKLKGIQPENVGPITAKPKWGKGSVRSYGAVNGHNQVTSININHQSNLRQATPRQATPRQATPRQATPRQGGWPASPRQARRESWIVINNQGTPQVEIIICNQYCTNCCWFFLYILLCLCLCPLLIIFFHHCH